MNKDKKIYLTFDMDWACDEVMDFLYNLLEEHDLSATVNITNYFGCIDKYKKNTKINLGIHPNFNILIDGIMSGGGVNDKRGIIEQCKHTVPNAVVVRSHSLFSSTPVTKAFYDCGIRYELNCYIEPSKGICIYPWFFQGVLQIPFFYEDDIFLMTKNENKPAFYLDHSIKMHRVFNFHPIHLFLNSESLGRYDRIRENYHNFSILKKNVNYDSYGTLDFFKELVEIAKEKEYQFETITEIEGRTNELLY